MNTNTATHTIVVKGVTGPRVEVVHPLRTNTDGTKTLVSYIKGANVATKWVTTNRITEVN